MDNLATSVDAMKLARRLQGLKREEYWLHLEADGLLEKYPAKQHARRVRDRLDVAEGLIYLPGAPARNNEDSDMPAPFRQRRYFYYLSGCNEASCHLAYDIKHDLLTLFIPRVNPDRVFWNGRGSTPAEAMDKYDVDEVFYVDQLESWIQEWFLHYRYDGSQRLYVLHKDQIPHSRYPWPVDTASLQPAMNQCRMIKDEHEIKLIRKANDISSKAHKQVLANITKFKNEAQVEGLFLNVCIANQAKQQAYDPIAASGPNAGTLHYDANNEDFGDRQLMCLDAGCEFELYASDITRTFPLSGSWPSKEAQQIYKLVERMQEACIRKLAPDVRYLDLHILAHHIAIDGLLKLGILHNGTREEIYKAGTSRAFFPHGLGHHVGLEVHDVGQRELMSSYEYPKYEKVPSLYPEDFHLSVYDEKLCLAPTHPHSPHLEEGMVVTVEPGIYFSTYVLSYFYLPSPVHSKYINTEVLHRYFPVGGVRIEDDILITSKGYENLTTAPKGDAMLEIIRTRGNSSTSKPQEQKNETLEKPLRCAPGISRSVADPVLKPISRAATEPIRGSGNRDSKEHAVSDHWLFKESENPPPLVINHQTETSHLVERQSSAAPQNSRLSLCGTPSGDVKHIFMGWQDELRRDQPSPYFGIGLAIAPKPKCQQCAVLSEAVDRLRTSLSRSTKNSPKTSPKPEAGEFERLDNIHVALDNTRPVPDTLEPVLPSLHPKPKEMRQITPLQPKVSANEPYHEHSYMPLSKPDDPHVMVCSFPREVLLKASNRSSLNAQRGVEHETRLLGMNPAAPSKAKAQKRSVTFDDFLPMQATQLPSHQGGIPASSDRYIERPFGNSLVQQRPNQSIPPLPASSLPPQTEAHTTVPHGARVLPGTASRNGLHATLQRESEREQYDRLRRDATPSLPVLRQAPTSRPAEEEKSILKSRRSMFMPTNTPAQEQDLRRRRSMGNTLNSFTEGSHVPQAQPALDGFHRRAPTAAPTNPYVTSLGEGPHRFAPCFADRTAASRSQMGRYNDQAMQDFEGDMKEIYGRRRPGGEELAGIDYAEW